MDKNRMLALRDKYENQAQKNYQTFQETGTTRYDTARRNAEEMVDVLSIAISAVDDHNSLTHLRTNLSRIASDAARIQYIPEECRTVVMQKVLNDLMSIARINGLLMER